MSGTGSVWAALPLARGATVLIHDANGLGAIAKPAGILAHPNSGGPEKRAVLVAKYDVLREAFEWISDGVPHRLYLLNRLDSATSGVMLVADNEELAVHARALFRSRAIAKTYIARVFGFTPTSPVVWSDRLEIRKTGGTIRAKTGAGIESKTVATVLKTSASEPLTSLLKLEPKTGRSHQLRTQCARHGVPIIGDQTYGDFRRNREFARATGMKRLFLHSLATEFDYEWKARKFHFHAEASLPPEFEVP